MMRVLHWIRNRIGKREQEKTAYRDLAPINDVSFDSEYIQVLDWALNNDRISNVAISAPFGAGKSSVIESYIKHSGEKVLKLSLACFENVGGKLAPYRIEEEFLKKLFYIAESSRIPQSRYRKINKVSLSQILIHLVFLLFVMIYYFVLFRFESVEYWFCSFLNHMEIMGFSQNLSVIILISITIILLFVISLLIRTVLIKWNIIEIDLFNKAKVKTSTAYDESVFNKYLDEIVYFFEVTEYKTVFIEDLDRYDSSELFVKLRELNLMLNNSDLIERHITFVYAIRDDYFSSCTDRTKFFDFIIPIIPYINNTNSDNLLRRRLIELNDSGIITDISDEYIIKVSPYISDMRVLINIMNEFVTYKKTIMIEESAHMTDEELLSLMIIKNLNPKVFSDTESEEGVITEAFRCKEKYIIAKIKQIEDSIIDSERDLESSSKETLKDCREIIQVLLQAIAPNCIIKNLTIMRSNKIYTYDQIIKPGFDLSVFFNEKIVVNSYSYNNTIQRITITDIESEYSGYIKRWREAHKREEERDNQIRESIEQKKDEIRALRKASLSSLINEYGLFDVFGSNTDIINDSVLVFMLRNGYITENYSNYINYYHGDSITKEEHEFIMNLRNNGGATQVSTNIVHPKRVLAKLVNSDFDHVEILNLSLVNYIIKEKTDSEMAAKLFDLLSDGNSETDNFIKEFIFSELPTVPAFVNRLAGCYSRLWVAIETGSDVSDATKEQAFNLIISNSSIDSIINMNSVDSCITEYMRSRRDILSSMNSCTSEEIISVIDALDIVFTDVSLLGVDPIIVDYIIENEAYEINITMLGEIIRFYYPDLYEKSQRQNYTILRELDDKRLLDYVHNNISEYIENVVLSETNNEERQDSIEGLIELISYDVDISIKIVSSQRVCFDSFGTLLSSINSENKESIQLIINNMIEQKKLDITWNNVEQYYDVLNITPTLFSAVVDNIDSLIKEEYTIDNDLIKDLLIMDWPLEKFRIFALAYQLESFGIELSAFSEERVEVLVSIHYIPFSIDLLQYIDTNCSSIVPCFFDSYKTDVIGSLDSIPAALLSVEDIVVSDKYTDDEKVLIINKCDHSRIGDNTITFVERSKSGINKDVVLEVFKQIPIDRKYGVLLNYLDVFVDDELPDLFNMLSEPYHSLAIRTNHQVRLANTDYNNQLLTKLSQRKYISSMDEEPISNKKKRLFPIEDKGSLVCRVRKAKTES